MDTKLFQKTIWEYFKKEGRTFSWRETTDPYKIWLSEVMLQQTQTSRVVEKYKEFLKAYPKVKDLADASLSKVLAMWQGLGYSRRALNMMRAATVVATTYKGKFPLNSELLDELPGVGPYTARAIYTFASNKPEVFIETNIRAVFIHFFFAKRKGVVSDEEIILKIKETLPKKDFRKWYYALMDYGVYLKKTNARKLNEKSKHYKKQSKFEGSGRQVRSSILKAIVESKKGITLVQLFTILPYTKQKIEEKIGELLGEKFIEKKGSKYIIHSNS